jgi:hypothetical protein
LNDCPDLYGSGIFFGRRKAMRRLFWMFLLLPAIAWGSNLSAAQQLVSGYTHGAGRVVWVHPGPAGLHLIQYQDQGKVVYGWMTSDDRYFLPSDNRQCVIDFYAPGIGGDLCDSVPYFHGRWRGPIEKAKEAYDHARGIG